MRMMAYGKDISDDILETIYKPLKDGERKGEYFINDVEIKSIPEETGKTVLLQIEPIPAGKIAMIRLNINQDALSGRSLEEINERVKGTRRNVAKTLEEAVIHERGHAKLIKGLSIDEIETLYVELSSKGLEGISTIAFEDGAEAIAEIEVLLNRGEEISEDAKALYNKYIRGK